MREEIAHEIAEGIELLERLFSSYEELLRKAEPNLVEMTAIASVLHSFYNGLENIFLRIAKEIDGTVPEGERWHRALLMQMAAAGENREAVLTMGCALKLSEYLGFRHFYRHSYSMFLDWGELVKLVKPLSAVWSQARSELQRFIGSSEGGRS